MVETTYAKEEMFFSKYAKKSKDTGGRQNFEEPCALRTDFERDRDRIIHAKAFRRLKNKTQVFLSPEGDHYRTRLTHTLDVAQIARTICSALNLNEGLAEAIALGHDLGHTPFGHTGENVLHNVSGHFFHNEQSLRVVDFLENDGEGLNLTIEVRDGILQHRKSGLPQTLEGKVVSFADRIAYINHDIDDCLRAGILKESDLPQKAVKVVGTKSRDRINNMVMGIVERSFNENRIEMKEEMLEATESLRDFMFDKFYINGKAKVEDEKANLMIETLYNYYYKNPNKLDMFYQNLLHKFTLNQVVCDYISGMTDRYAVWTFENIFVPSSWQLK